MITDSDFVHGVRQVFRFAGKWSDLGCWLTGLLTFGLLLVAVIVVPVQWLMSRRKR